MMMKLFSTLLCLAFFPFNVQAGIDGRGSPVAAAALVAVVAAVALSVYYLVYKNKMHSHLQQEEIAVDKEENHDIAQEIEAP